MNRPISSVVTLIPELKCGDESAWNSLCEKFRLTLTDQARRMCLAAKLNKGSADDLVQETLIKAWSQHDSFRGDSTAQFSAWLIRILRNTFIDWSRVAQLEMNQPTWYGFLDDGESPSAVAISQEQEASLYAALAEMDERSASVLMLRHFEGLKFVEIANEIDLNINTVVGIYRRGVVKLSEMVKT